MPDVVVELGSFTGLTLDDPVLGLLDSGILDGGISFEPVTEGVFSVSTARGRNRDLERTNAGSLSVSLRNQERQFDPQNPASPFQQFVVPRRPVRVRVDDEPIFTGQIDDWSFTYSPNGDSVSSFQASDAFAIFARNLNTGEAVPEELTGARLNRVLDQTTVQWPALLRDIEDGNSTLAVGVLEDNTLGYMSGVIEASEKGLVFVTKGGRVAFRERLLATVTDAVTFSDSGAGIRYEDVSISFGTELMVNQAIVEFPDGVVTAEDLTSQVTFGITEKTLTTELSSEAQAQAIADFLIAKFSTPEYRVGSVTVNLRAMSEAEQVDVLGLELGDQADIVFRPNGIGAAIAVRNRVIGVAHDVGLLEHRVTFNFEELPFEFFVLDSAVFGKLDDDAGVLGF